MARLSRRLCLSVGSGLLAILGVAAAGAPKAAAAALGAPFASVPFNCAGTPYDERFRGTVLPVDHRFMVAQAVITSGSGSISIVNPGMSPNDMQLFDTGEALWFNPSFGYLAGDEPEISAMGCSGSGRVDFYDEPTAPTTYPFAQEQGSFITMGARFPGRAQAVIDVQLAQGAIEYCGLGYGGTACKGRTVASSGTYSIGTVSSGDQGILVRSLDGPIAQGEITIRTLPVTATALHAVPAAVRPGSPFHFSYSLDGDAAITGIVRDSGGEQVRVLAQDAPTAPGEHTLTWDGTRKDASPLPTGTYTLELTARDPYGNATVAQTQVTLDASAPVVQLRTPRSTRGLLGVLVTDTVSGPSDAVTAEIGTFGSSRPARVERRSAHTKEAYFRSPAGSWPTHTRIAVRIHARDNAGNATTRTTVFSIGGRARAGSRRGHRTLHCAAVLNPYPNSRYAGVPLSHITATGVSCAMAREVARGAHGKALALPISPGSTRRLRWRGWNVSGNLRPAHDRYVATRGRARVTWWF